MKIAILSIGNELLSGDTINTNAGWMGRNLTDIGCDICRQITVPDKKDSISNALTELVNLNPGYIICTGGLGPTHDDITAQSISKAFKVKYENHKEAFQILENYYGKSKFNDGRKKMAKMPRGSKLIYNPSSAAPGFIIKNVISLPGVPSILNSMIENCKRYLIKGLKVHSKTLNLFTLESNISKQLGLIQKKYKKFVDIGSYPFFRLGKIGVSVVTRSTSKIKLQSVNRDLIKLVRLKKIEILKI